VKPTISLSRQVLMLPITGYNQTGGLEELTPEETFAQFNTNVFGLLNTTRAFLPYMRAARSGVIANLSSVGAWMGAAGVGLYCASKWTVSGLTESLYEELKEFNIKVCCVEPGYFRSNFLNPSNKQVGGQSNVIADYDGDSAVRKGIEMMEYYNNKQPGDIKKGCKLMIDVLTEATGRPVPMRLYMGADAYQAIGDKCRGTLQVLEDWKDLSTKTDLDVQ
jgi:NAD(P)-dependent dehydrogenase (short-subunit alcohol dehydrogenase family)